jgi:multicomponent Na+:H+ antiporter subunit C
METSTLYAMTGMTLFVIGLHGLIAQPHLLRKILAVNVMSAGVFLVLIGMAQRTETPDPVPHAMVLTGIVVAVAATAAALVLATRVREATGKCELPDEQREDDK